MQAENIEAFIALFFDAWNRGDQDTVTSMVAPDAIDHNAETGESGAASLLRTYEEIRRAFPDLQYTIYEIAIDPKRQLGVCNVRAEGTHEDAYRDIPATGRRVTWREMRMGRFRDGRLTEHWTVSELRGELARE